MDTPSNPYNPNATHVLPGGEEPFGGVDLGALEKSLLRPRNFISYFCTVATAALTFSALIPLISVLVTLAYKGMARINWETLTSLPLGGLDEGGGFGNAIEGTLVIVALALVISLPFGILGAIYIGELAPKSHLSKALRFCAKVLTGFPSVLAGVFAYGVIVIMFPTIGRSPYAGAVALSILMIPVILLTAEDAIKAVPHRMKEAAIGMGSTPTQVIWHVLIPTAFPGILTGVMLAVARAAGETAPLLLTSTISDFWLRNGKPFAFRTPTASLAVFIYNGSGSPYENQQELAWAAALVLVAMVLVFNLVGQSLTPKTQTR
jgi:phosphate transport system permease protein